MLLGVLFLLGWKEKEPPLFKLLPGTFTGIQFRNTIFENDSLNILNEAYIYNGGGVGLGDFNNDGLPDIYFSGNMTSNKLYLNKGGMKFRDVTAVAAVTGEGRWCTGVSVVDINTDGRLDIYVCATFLKDPRKRKNMLYINQGNNKDGIPVFKESAESYGIADDGYSTQGVFFDYDNDRDLDLFVLTNTLDDPKTSIQFRPKVMDGTALNTDRLYRNNGNATFTNVSREAGILIEGWGHAVSISDINRDGWPDIYVSNDFNSNDIFYLNNKDGTFTDRIADYFKHTSWYTMGTDIVDMNNDGWADVIALDMLPENNLRKKGMLIGNEYYNYFNARQYNYQHQYIRNVFQLNSGMTPLGHPIFNDVGFISGIYQTDWSWAPLAADFDNDGYRDLIVTNGLPRDVTDLDYISFDNAQPAGAMNTSMKMVNVLPVVKISNYAFKNAGGFMFKNASTAWGINQPAFSNGGVYADLDNDGDLDIVINNINESAFIYENSLRNTNKANTHHLSLVFKGSSQNPGGFGATVRIHYDHGKLLYYEHQPCRGYLSTVDAKAHFGLGAAPAIDSLIVSWPDGNKQLVTNIKADQTITLAYNDASAKQTEPQDHLSQGIFQEASAGTNIKYQHREREAVDYNIQPTLPHKLSQFGPGIAVGDIDNNGQEDFYIGGAPGGPGKFFLQDANGTFTIDSSRFIGVDNTPTEEMGLLFFDADNDKDLDLYVVNGSYEFSPTYRGNQDRLYINNGKGVFTYDYAALPYETTNGSCVKAADFDRDGDLDLFVGGRSVSGLYPAAPDSYLLQNQGNGKFVDVTEQFCPRLKNIGMVTDALWSDFDNDGKADLVLAGEWMPITFLRNMTDSFSIVKTSGVEKHTGWWNSLVAGDFDNDGDVDYAAGNLGLNSSFQASLAEPMTILSKDLDQNGKADPMVFCYMKAEDGTRKPFPMHTRDDLVSQLISIRKKYPTYKAFGRASINELWTAADRQQALIMHGTNLSSSLIENKGKGQFSIKSLPLEAQVAPVFGMLSEDVDGDGNLDLVMVGNDYGMEPGSGRHDAFMGLCLKGDGKGGFTPLPLSQTGFFVNGDGKALVKIITSAGDQLLIASQNQDSLKVFSNRNKGLRKRRFVPLEPDDFYADIVFKDKSRRRIEFYYGSGFLSQSSRTLEITDNVSAVTITDFTGKKQRTYQ